MERNNGREGRRKEESERSIGEKAMTEGWGKKNEG